LKSVFKQSGKKEAEQSGSFFAVSKMKGGDFLYECLERGDHASTYVLSEQHMEVVVMLNSLIDAIAMKINQELGDEITIYKEPQQQGFAVPCFFINLHASNQKRMVGKRYYREQQFDIEYHPGTTAKKAQINDIIDKLNDALEIVTMESDTFRGTKMRCEVVDDILHFYVNYNFHVYKVAEAADIMESVELDSEIKKE
jgi:hypothetical protein